MVLAMCTNMLCIIRVFSYIAQGKFIYALLILGNNYVLAIVSYEQSTLRGHCVLGIVF